MRSSVASSFLLFLALSGGLLAGCPGEGDGPGAGPDDAGPGSTTPDAGPDARALPETCTNGVLDPDESDVDCGEVCGSNCAAGRRCQDHDDCTAEAVCAEGPRTAEGKVSVCHSRVAACQPGVCGDGLCFTLQTTISAGAPPEVVHYCEPRAALDTPCRRQDDKDRPTCVDGAACVEVTSKWRKCEARTTPLGASCSTGVDTCTPGTVCAADRFGQGIECRAPVAAGGACSMSPACAANLYCDFGSNSCQPRGSVGSTCTTQSSGSCAPGLVCDPALAKCIVYVPPTL
jgi:hypothetical protein